MNTMTLLEASGNLAKVIESTINNSDETVIVSQNGPVVYGRSELLGRDPRNIEIAQ